LIKKKVDKHLPDRKEEEKELNKTRDKKLSTTATIKKSRES
jgi:hypothetical protein